jgi:hypothetical protein
MGIPRRYFLVPNPVLPIAASLGGITTATILSEGLKSPKAIGLFYVKVAKSCYVATGSKRIACVAAAGVCGVALIPGPHQAPFLVACAASLRGVNKL